MLALPTSPEGFHDDVELREIECDDCGATGYVPDHMHGVDVPRTCEDCDREDLRQILDPESDHPWGRTEALDRLDTRNMLPVRDPVDGQMIVEVDVDRGPPGSSSYIKHITKIVERECPECGYDRANESHWKAYTCESGEVVRCRACSYEIEEHSTL